MTLRYIGRYSLVVSQLIDSRKEILNKISSLRRRYVRYLDYYSCHAMPILNLSRIVNNIVHFVLSPFCHHIL